MSLLDDLKGLDLGPIEAARGTIRATVGDQDLQALVTSGAAQAALASLGGALGELKTALAEPAALVRPLADAVGGLSAHLSIDDLPLGRYGDAVRAGAGLVAGLLTALQGDPAAFGAALGRPLGGILDQATSIAGGSAGGFAGGLADVQELIARVEQGLPSDAGALATLALEIALPFPADAAATMRDGLGHLLDGLAALDLPATRTAGLVAAFDAVATTAAGGDAAALARTLHDLERVRDSTFDQLQNDFRDLLAGLGRLHVIETLERVANAAGVFRRAELGVLEFLERWRRDLVRARQLVARTDSAALRNLLVRLLDAVEAAARRNVVEPIDRQVRQLVTWVRGLFRKLGLRRLRDEVTAFLHGVARAIADANLDGPADAVRERLEAIRAVLEPEALRAEVQAALGRVKAQIDRALDPLVHALDDIGAAVGAVATQAEGILARAADGLTQFQQAVDQAAATVDELGIESAAEQVADTLRRLRETAEKLLGSAPLPEPMRPTVEQMIDVLEGIDFAQVLAPVREAVAGIELPADVLAAVQDGIAETRRVVDGLIPDELIRSIDAEVADALDVLRRFEPAELLQGVTGFLAEQATFVEQLDPRPVVADVRAPFQAVLDGLDAVHPDRLLGPVVAAWDEMLASLPLPAPDTVMRRTADLVSAAGERVMQQASAPLRQAAGPQAAEVTAPPGPALPPLELPPDVRAGDIVRLLGFLPARLREQLAVLEAGPAGEVLATIDGLTGGLARQLRAVHAALRSVEARLDATIEQLLAPVAAAHLRARAALHARATAGAVSVDLDASLALLAAAGPGRLRADLGGTVARTREAVRGLAAGTRGDLGALLDRAATALERTALGAVAGDLDALLAALDPEPIAAELDALVLDIIERAPALLGEAGEALEAAATRFRTMLRDLGPGAQAQKLLRVLDVLREELDLLDPRRLAVELGEIHDVVRQTVAAYDPAVFAEELAGILGNIAQALRALDGGALLGDLALFDGTLARVEAALPTKKLAGVGAELRAVGTRLAAIDLQALAAKVEQLPPRVLDAFTAALDTVRDEIVALLKALRYATENASVSVQAEARVG